MLCVQMQGGQLTVWFQCDTEQPLVQKISVNNSRGYSMNVKPGQTVFVANRGHGPKGITEEKVYRVGRLYFYLEGPSWHDRCFHIENGYIKTEYSDRTRVYETQQEIEDEREINKLQDYLQRFFSWNNYKKLTLEQLRGVAKIVGGPDDDKS